MGVLHKQNSCPDCFTVFICGATCVSIQKNELVMRNTERKGCIICVCREFDWSAVSRKHASDSAS